MNAPPSVLPTSIAASQLAVSTSGLTKRFGDVIAVRDLALQVPDSAVYLLVGPNGAGKSTTLKLLLGLVHPDAGSANVLGVDVTTDSPLVRANTGYVPEEFRWGNGWMTVGRQLEHHRRFYSSWDESYATRLAKLFDLRMEQRVSTLSKGQARRVHLVMALAHRPALLVLDEPTDGLDPVMRDETLGVLAEHLAETPTTVLLSTHHVEEVERIADHVGVIRGGELHAQIPVLELRRKLLRYRAGVPEGWAGAPSLNGAVLRRTGVAREVEWTIWGDEAVVARALEGSGAVVRESISLSLSDATLALLNPGRST